MRPMWESDGDYDGFAVYRTVVFRSFSILKGELQEMVQEMLQGEEAELEEEEEDQEVVPIPKRCPGLRREWVTQYIPQPPNEPSLSSHQNLPKRRRTTYVEDPDSGP